MIDIKLVFMYLLLLLFSGWINTIEQNIAFKAVKGHTRISGGSAATKCDVKFTLSKAGEKAKIRNRYNQIPHLTQDTIWESDKNTRKHHLQESQEVSPFQGGDHKVAKNRQDSMADIKHIKQKGSTT